MGRAYDYSVLAKPKVLLAMMLLYVTSFFASYAYAGGGPLDVNLFLIGLTAVTAAVSGANAMNCYLDRDIDALMTRTFKRPLASGTMEPGAALYFSGILITVSSVIAFSLGAIPFTLFLLGSSTYLVLYTVILKRKTALNVFATTPSVATPAWFGWYLGGAALYPVGLLMGLLVALWGPIHLWSLAYAYSNDYSKADVPMLPSVVSEENASRGVLVALAVLITSSYTLMPWTTSTFYPLAITVVNLLIGVAGVKFYLERSLKAGWWIFKLTAPHIVIVFLAFMVERIIFA